MAEATGVTSVDFDNLVGFVVFHDLDEPALKVWIVVVVAGLVHLEVVVA